MLVSVIIPAYNSEKTIRKTLQSVFDQDYHLIEIIVVNDGSTDSTEQILKEYSDRIIYIYQANAGVSVARNTGYRVAKGEFIQYLDADDLLAKGKIKIQIEALKSNNADVAYGDWIKFTETEYAFKELEIISREIQGRAEIELLTDFWVPLAGLLYKRTITEKIGTWNLKLPIIQDARYALDAAIHQAKFIYTPGVMGYYRVHESGSVSTKSKYEFMMDCFENAKQVHLLWRDSYEVDVEKKNAIIRVLRFCINEFSKLDKNKYKEAVELVLQIAPDYLPDNKGFLRTMSKLIGYKAAEQIAYYKRKLR